MLNSIPAIRNLPPNQFNGGFSPVHSAKTSSGTSLTNTCTCSKLRTLCKAVGFLNHST